MYQCLFERYETKFLINEKQLSAMLSYIENNMQKDQYGDTTIKSLYFDTPGFLLIRRSLESPLYKEKLRLRGYDYIDDSTTVFAEIKKKFKGVVYKRRIALPCYDAMNWLQNRDTSHPASQISKEIDFLFDHYGLLYPSMLVSCRRQAYVGKDDLRITFDSDIYARRERLFLTDNSFGTPLLEDGVTLMEIKCSGVIPFPLSQLLSKNQIFKTKFSKYGRAYSFLVQNKKQEITIDV